MQYKEINHQLGDLIAFDLMSEELLVPEFSLMMSMTEFRAITDAWIAAKQCLESELMDRSASQEQYEQAMFDTQNIGSYPVDTLSALEDYDQYKPTKTDS